MNRRDFIKHIYDGEERPLESWMLQGHVRFIDQHGYWRTARMDGLSRVLADAPIDEVRSAS